MAFSAQDVKNLREMTGVGMMDCKKALTEADGDMDKAVEWLREKGLAAAQKKAGRIAAEGIAYAEVYGSVGVVVEVNAETDFVAMNELFIDFTKTVASVVAKENPADVEALLACKYPGTELTVEQMQKIVGLMCRELIKRAKDQLGIDLTIRDSVKKHIVETGMDKKYGARPLRRAVQNQLEDKLAEAILSGEIRRNMKVVVGISKKEIKFTAKTTN